MNGDIYLADIQNRYTSGAGFTVSVTTRGALTLVTVINGTVDGHSEQASRDNAIWNVRLNLVGGTDVLAKITTTQRNAASNVQEGQMIWNTSTSAIETYIGATWV